MAEIKITEDMIKPSAPSTKLINNISVSTSDVEIDPSRNLWFRLFAPSITQTNPGKNLPLIVYFHGGGFARFGPETKIYDDLCSHLAAKLPAVVASVNYRLTPHHKYPSQYQDAHDALKFIDARNSPVFPAYTDFSTCFVAGDSAGANIAHHLTVRALKYDAEKFKQIKISGILSLQPFFGGEERTESELRLKDAPIINVARTDMLWREFLPEGENRDHPAVNVFRAAEEIENLRGFPATLVIVGGKDALQDWGKRYAEWLKNCGKEVEITMYSNAFHAFYAFPEMPERDLLFQRLAKFVQKHGHVSEFHARM